MESKKVHDEATQAAVADAFRKGPKGMDNVQRTARFPGSTQEERDAQAADAEAVAKAVGKSKGKKKGDE